MSAYTGTDNLEVMAEAVNYNAFLVDLVRRHAGRAGSVVDFGAGIGTFAREMRQAGYRVHCIEPDVKQAATIAAAGLDVSASVDALEDGSVDFLYSLNVLEHIEDDEAILRSWTAKLKPGGRILIYVPAFQVLFSSMDAKVGHVRRYRLGDLAGKVRRAGFRIATARYVDSLGFFAALAFRLFGNDRGDIDRRGLMLYDRFAFPLSRVCDVLLSRVVGKNLLVIADR